MGLAVCFWKGGLVLGTRSGVGVLDEGTAVAVFVNNGEVNGVTGLEGGGAMGDCGSRF